MYYSKSHDNEWHLIKYTLVLTKLCIMKQTDTRLPHSLFPNKIVLFYRIQLLYSLERYACRLYLCVSAVALICIFVPINESINFPVIKTLSLNSIDRYQLIWRTTNKHKTTEHGHAISKNEKQYLHCF